MPSGLAACKCPRPAKTGMRALRRGWCDPHHPPATTPRANRAAGWMWVWERVFSSRAVVEPLI